MSVLCNKVGDVVVLVKNAFKVSVTDFKFDI